MATSSSPDSTPVLKRKSIALNPVSESGGEKKFRRTTVKPKSKKGGEGKEEKKEKEKKQKKVSKKGGSPKPPKPEIKHVAVVVPDHEQFDVQSIDQLEKAKQYLHLMGYAMLRNVLTKEEIVIALDLFWSYFEQACAGLDRNLAATWTNHHFPGIFSVGILKFYGTSCFFFAFPPHPAPTQTSFSL